MDYLYDGTFEGLLCCIFSHYYEEEAEGIFLRDVYQQNLLRQARYVETDEEKAERVYRGIREKISAEALRRVYAVYLSSEEEKEMKILKYVAIGFRMGGRVNLLHGDPVVYAVQQAEKKVYNERHRYLGILRFSVIVPPNRSQWECKDLERGASLDDRRDQVLYARLEPDHDVIELMAGHFADRYKNDPFILHDIKREKAVFGRGGRWYVAKLPRETAVRLGMDEREYRRLWKRYFQTIAVEERTNPRCQKLYMPLRYWKHLTEMQD